MRIAELGQILRMRTFWNTPYRTGNLARSIGDGGSMGANAYGFAVFTKSAPYGAILNEVPVITYKLTNKYTGAVYTGSYVNKHYHWVDNLAEQWANEMPSYINIRRL